MLEKNISRRAMIKATLLAGTGTLLAACQPAAAPTATKEAPKEEEKPVEQPPAEEDVTISFWTWAEANFPHYEQQAERWNSTFTDKPKIKYEGVLIPSTEETISKAMNAMAAGSGVPDILLIEISQMSKFLKGEPTLADENLVDLVPKLDVYDSKWRENYIGFAPYSWKGKTFGFEIGLCPTGYYYRSDLFEEAGIEMPLATWDDFMVAGAKMKEAGHAMVSLDTASMVVFVMDLYQAGGSLFNENGDLTLEEERAYKTLDLIMAGVKDGSRWTTEAYWGPPHYAALNDGTVAGVISAIWYSPHVLKPNAQETAGKWRVQPMPAWSTSGTWGGPEYNTRQTSTWGGTALTIPKVSANPDITFDFLAFSHLTVEGAKSVYQVMGQMPMVKSVIHDDAVTNIPDEFYGGQAINKVFADIADYIPPKFPNPFWNEAEQELNQILAPALAGEGTSEELLKGAAGKIRDLIAIG